MATKVSAPKFVEVERLGRFQSELQASEPKGIVQHSSLSEMLGLIFGLMTLTWILSSLFALI